MAASSGALTSKPEAVRPITGARSKRKPSMPVRMTQLRIASIASCTDGRPVERKRVAAAGVIHQFTACMAVVERIVEAAQRQRGAMHVALARMVEHHVEDDAKAGLMKRHDGLADLGEAAGRQPRIGRHEGDRIVAPGIAKPSAARCRSSIQAASGMSSTVSTPSVTDVAITQGSASAATVPRIAGGTAGCRMVKALTGNFIDEARPRRRQDGCDDPHCASTMHFGTRCAVSAPRRMRSA